jgi:hypothetical protein
VNGALPTATGSLLDTIELQRAGCELAGSPLYAEVLDAVAADVRAGGPSAAMLLPLADAPFGDAVLLRLLAAVHRAVLRGDAPDLAAHYPSAGGRPGRGLGGAFLAAAEAHAHEVRASLGRGVQTNEPGRSVALLGGYLELARLGLPLRLLEVGASAGLNLRFDRYRYESGADAFGPAGSPVRFVAPWAGRPPELGLGVEVASREGCDVDPVDPTTDEGRLWLRGFLWPDQPERRARLDGALAVAAEVPVTVERSGAVPWLRDRLAEPVPGVVTVVAHSIVFQYLAAEDRRAFLDVLDRAGRRATPDAPLAWLRMEPGGDRAETRVTTWPGGATHLLSTSAFHGPPVAWLPEGPVVRRR